MPNSLCIAWRADPALYPSMQKVVPFIEKNSFLLANLYGITLRFASGSGPPGIGPSLLTSEQQYMKDPAA